ncbi:adenylate/guanylate cyclase domain-containing protein [Thalassobaculum sp.]|uniref:adenylate/guanylate cyclase domain-containing protein n=1 Tax=Thalassobaculum sp. TaxID=2022740 RepID=UPI0032EC6143
MTSSDPGSTVKIGLPNVDADSAVGRHLRVLHDGGGSGMESPTARPDPALPPITWLLTEASSHTSTRTLIRDLSALLTDRGLPLTRVTCFVRTLHPQTSGSSVVWLRDRPDPRSLRILRGMEDTPAFQASPMPLIFEGAAAIRRRLDLPEQELDFPVLADLRDMGATDYVAMPLAFSDGMINFMTWATDRPGGFSTEELTVLWDLLPALALRIEVIEQRDLTRQLLEVYLGRQTGRRVLAGAIARGETAAMRAAVWYSDIKDFTVLSDKLPRQDIIDLLNSYFEAAVQAVEERGGEILKFLGDGMLAIFPAEGPVDREADRAACAAAIGAARDTVQLVRALNRRRLKQDKPVVDFGIALHIGEVGYGNIGGLERLDFTVIGPAVNLASRIEGLTRNLGVRVLASAEFASAADETLTAMGRHPVKGLERPVEVFAPSDLL